MQTARIFHSFLDLFLPTSCSFCKESVAASGIPFFCSSCWSDFTVLSGPLCPCCGRPFESPESLTVSPDHWCLRCRQDPPVFDQALSVGHFEGPLREAIHQFKYRPCRSLGRPLGRWVASHLRLVSPVDLVMPVPLHRSRLRDRGFNQALLLAHEISAACQLSLSYDNLQRVRETKPQVELSPADRIKNVKDAFAVCHPSETPGKSILLIDDVFTTGATLNECARVLKEEGALHVTALTAARAF